MLYDFLMLEAFWNESYICDIGMYRIAENI